MKNMAFFLALALGFSLHGGDTQAQEQNSSLVTICSKQLQNIGTVGVETVKGAAIGIAVGYAVGTVYVAGISLLMFVIDREEAMRVFSKRGAFEGIGTIAVNLGTYGALFGFIDGLAKIK